MVFRWTVFLKAVKAGKIIKAAIFTLYPAPWVHLTTNPLTELTPFLPPNFVDTNVHAAVAELAVGDYLCKI